MAGKPFTIASNEAINPGTARLANNGRVTLWEMWGDHKSEENWIQIDLEKEENVSRFKVFTFWDAFRYYQYTIEGSVDGSNWDKLVDFRENTVLSTSRGYQHQIEPVRVRFLRLNMLFNSANPGLHVVEFAAWKD